MNKQKIVIEKITLIDNDSTFAFKIIGRMDAIKNSLMNKIANSTTYPITIVDEWRLSTWNFNAWTGTLAAVKITPSPLQRIHYGHRIASKMFGPYHLYHFNISVISRYVEFDIGENIEPIHAKTTMYIANEIVKYLRMHNKDESAGVEDIFDITKRESDTGGSSKGVHMARIIIEGYILAKRPMRWLNG
jgi:hypothetical protein